MKAYTDLNQSKKLAKILPIESADMWWAERYVGQVMANGQYIVEEKPVYYPSLTKPSNGNYSQDTVKDIPCWSLAALLGVLPRSIEFKGDKYYLRFMKEYVEYANDEISITGRCLHTTGNDNLVDACYEMILKLNKLKML